jgi:glycosyltransferase involved in cell wall biosynthesis
VTSDADRKIIHISFSKSGGAGRVANNLSNIQSKHGLTSQFHFEISKQLKNSLLDRPILSVVTAFDNYLVKNQNNPNLVSLFRSNIPTVKNLELIDSPTVIHLHWVTDLHFLKRIAKISKNKNFKIVWTMHDMWPLTGVCHLSEACEKFESDCASCPQVKKIFQNKVVSLFEEKREILSSINDLSLVFPSKWLSSKFETLLKSRYRYVVIPNPIDETFFQSADGIHTKRIRLLADEITFGLSAANLSDGNKRIDWTVDHLNRWSKTYNKKIKIMVAGSQPNSRLLDKENIKYVGNLQLNQLATFYNSMDYFLNFSINENLPVSLIEAQACGIPTLTKHQGGRAEIVKDGVTGVLVENDKHFDLELNRLLGLNRSNLVKLSLEHFKSNFSDQSIHEQYLNVYKN